MEEKIKNKDFGCKTYNVGLIEKYRLKRAGRKDGKKGLPKETEDGDYRSPFVKKEVAAFKEFTFKSYTDLQKSAEEDYARLGILHDIIYKTQKDLDLAKQEYNKAFSSLPENVIYKGEDRLTDSQVRSRRKYENDKRLAPFKNRISLLEQSIHSEFTEYIAIRNKTIEKANTTRLICNTTREHVQQRIAVYWDAAITHNSKLPPAPEVELSSDAEEIFLKPHKEFLEEVDSLILDYKSNKEE